MTDPLTLTVAGAALGVAALACWYSLPNPPDLDGERWFKLILATLLRGQVERETGDAGDWEARVLRFVPYHPGGRLPEQKVSDPEHYRPPGLSVPGEVALVEALARIEDRAGRWKRMYDEDDAAIEARLQDPAEMGAAYDTARHLGPGGSWDDLADWGAGDAIAFREVLVRRLSARWVLVDGGEGPWPPLLDALAGELGDLAVRVSQPEGSPEEAASVLRDAMEDPLEELSDRLVLVVTGPAIHLVLRALVDAPGLRDRLLAVVSVGGVVMGREGELTDWMGRWFNAAAFDTEMNRVTPYLHLTWYDRETEPPGIPRLPIAATRFPQPEAGALSSIEVVDLGVLPADPELPLDQVARALWTLTTLWVYTRR
ncbi:MAG: hypothetical protein JRI25_03975 [Deltaproteobacteria bacterium]|nr:hypothetical protein [Deltaproteobacteria bacterium]MBW2253737.1 hypothetical protein [Deltaproteobacteria bacterium]